MSIPDAAYNKLEKFSEEQDAILEKRNDAGNHLRCEFRQRMEPLFAERAKALSAVKNFWAGIVAAPETPLSPLMNNTIDPKLGRAVEAIKVTYRISGKMLHRKVEVTLCSNMFAEAGVVSREVDSDGKTHSVQSISWKSGTERSRSDSLFRYFDEKSDMDALLVSDVTDGFDIIFQDPFLADLHLN